MAKNHRTSNDQRSDAHNSTSSENRASTNNRSEQMNKNNPKYSKSKGN